MNEQKELDTTEAKDFSAFDDYAAWTDSVAQYPPDAEPFYLALGIADEIGEYSVAVDEDSQLAEAGDVMWYCARYATRVLGVPFSDVVRDSVNSSPRLAMANVGIICGFEKKRIRDGESWSEEKRAQKAAQAYTALCCIIAWVQAGIWRRPISLREAISYNRSKLSMRLEAGTIKGDGDNR